MSDVQGLVESLAAEVVLCDPESQATVDTLIASLETAFSAADAVDDEVIAALARSAVSLLDDMVEGSSDPGVTMAAVRSIVTQMQHASAVESATEVTPPPEPTSGAPEDAGNTEADLREDLELLTDFVTRSFEHLEAAEEGLLRIESGDEDPETVNAVFRCFHTIKGMAGFLGLNDIQEASHDAEGHLDKARTTGSVPDRGMISALIETLDTLRSMTGQVLSGKTSTESVAPVADDGALPSQQVHPEDRRPVVRVDAARLDQLLDAVGELVVAESMVSRFARESTGASDYSQHLDRLDKVTREVQETATWLRMIRLRPTFLKMNRIARDTAARAGKSVDFIAIGEETELDKAVVDSMVDPLMHLVRNAIDHGIEYASVRVAAGKPERGRVEMRAFHRAGNVHIEIEDDGAGLDSESILAQARARGLVAEDATLSAEAAADLIFRPGFSTATRVTDVSGRGVGMDVVHRVIEGLHGHVEVRSAAGVGTTFSIRLPLTLAIMDGMVVSAGREEYVIPTASIIRSVRPEAQDVVGVLGSGEMLRVGDSAIRLVRLADIFGIEDAHTDPTTAIAVIVESDDRHIAVLVDELIGQVSAVVKPLSGPVRSKRGIAGAAVMSDGQAALIIDVSGLLKGSIGSGVSVTPHAVKE